MGVPGTPLRNRAEKDPHKFGSVKPIFGTGVGIEKISPSGGWAPPCLAFWWNKGPDGTMLEEL